MFVPHIHVMHTLDMESLLWAFAHIFSMTTYPQDWKEAHFLLLLLLLLLLAHEPQLLSSLLRLFYHHCLLPPYISFIFPITTKNSV